MSRILTLIVALAVTGCGSPTGPDWADPLRIDFDESLNIDLSQMNLTETGLYWQDLVEGTGQTADVGNTIFVHHTGWLPDGTMIETTRDGDMLSFKLGVGLAIKGMDEGLVGMNAGGIRKLVIPPHLAYGSRRDGPVPARSTVVYEVELFYVVK